MNKLIIIVLFGLLIASQADAAKDVQAERFLKAAKIYDFKASEMDLVQMWMDTVEIDHAVFVVYTWTAKGEKGEWPADLPKLNNVVINRAGISFYETEDKDVLLLSNFVRQHGQAAQFYMMKREAFDRYMSFMGYKYLANSLRYIAERVQTKYGKGRKIIPPEEE